MEKAEVLQKCFSSVYTNESDAGTTPSIVVREYISQLPEIEITQEKVLKKISVINVNKSQGPDALHRRLCSELKKVLAEPLRIIFIKSLLTMSLPKVWKQAIVFAIHKNGNKSEPENYKPISLACIACKPFEQIIREHIFELLKENNLLSERQYGFISGRSTVLQLLTVLEKWTKIFDERNSVDVVYMDFQKAFDKVAHNR